MLSYRENLQQNPNPPNANFIRAYSVDSPSMIKTAMFEAPDIPGAADVIAWFGYWPTFHDAEVLSITLDRSDGSRVAIHAFEMTAEVDTRGRYVLAKHAVVTFYLEGFPRDKYGITNTRIDFFNSQNVLSSASVNKIPEGFDLVLEGIYGVDGSITCEHLSIKLEPGIPQGSMYQVGARK
jgi:hypothetical protein